jgi:hypothetical protein
VGVFTECEWGELAAWFEKWEVDRECRSEYVVVVAFVTAVDEEECHCNPVSGSLSGSGSESESGGNDEFYSSGYSEVKGVKVSSKPVNLSVGRCRSECCYDDPRLASDAGQGDPNVHALVKLTLPPAGTSAFLGSTNRTLMGERLGGTLG